MYYIYSFIASLIIFMLIEWRKYESMREIDETYSFEFKSLVNFIALYIVTTMLLYAFILVYYDNNMNIESDNNSNIQQTFNKPSSIKGGSCKSESGDILDYSILKKIPEEVNTGFGFM